MGLLSLLASKKAKAENEARFLLASPLSGELIELEASGDPAFASHALGEGVAIVPTEGHVVSPCSGTIGAIFPTSHALAIQCDDGRTQVMVHIGIDTVGLGGKGFVAHVGIGDRVETGTPLVDVDVTRVTELGYKATTFVTVCEHPEGERMRHRATGSVNTGEPIIWLV